MKIIAMVRTRDEERNIGRFCETYSKIADTILVADGGSEDRTLEIASSFPNVEIRHFTERTEMGMGYWRNNDSDHINYLIAWACEYEADWIILDDCDCVPNYSLQQEGRLIFRDISHDVVMAVRLYLWGTTEHFPYMAKPDENHENYEASLWAWRPEIDLLTVDVPPAFTLTLGGEDVADLHDCADVLDLMPPFCLLHHSWDDPDITYEKIKVYRESGLIPGQLHPLDFAGPVEPLPSWARV